jgi:TonB family protein
MAEAERSESESNLIGVTIAGRYRVVSKIARGGMGMVYKAEQSALGRSCAIKVLSPKYEGDKDPEFHKRFSLEAATAAKLNHPNTVTIFDYGKDEEHGVYFIAMEYLDGRTLHRIIHDEAPLAEERANRIAQQVCRSLNEAHKHGIVHRDLKPGNVMLLDRGDEHDVVKVLDFGLVKDVSGRTMEDLTQTGIFMGSPKYMSPEQVMNGVVSAKTDIYALGIILYEMLAGKPPFDKGASMSTLVAHVNDPPPPFAKKNPEAKVSAGMEAIVLRCLEKEPDKRFASMRDLLATLKRETGDLTETAESLPRVRPEAMDAPASRRSAPEESGSVPRGARPPMSSSASGPQTTLISGDDAARASQTSQPIASAQAAPARATMWRVYAVAIGAAVVGSIGAALALGVARQREPTHTTVRVVETVQVPVALPAAALSVTASNPAAGLRLVRIESEPSGARVADRNTEVCISTPCEIVFRGEGAKVRRTLTLTKAGFKPAQLVVEPDAEKAVATLDVYPWNGAGTPPPEAAPPAATPSAAPSATPSAAPSAAAAAPPPPAATPSAAPSAVAAAVSAPAPSATEAPTAKPAAPAVMPFGEGMSRPVPIAGPSPVYTREAREAKVGGTVIAKCVITQSGSLSGCRIIKGVPHMDGAVLEALARAKYQPVMYQGNAVAVDYVFSLKLVPP